MNHNVRHTVLFSMLGALAIGAAWAHDDMFQSMDSNHDGRISAQEHATGAQAMFTRADANHDGAIDAQEMAAGRAWMRGDHDRDRGMRGGMLARMMAHMDSNHDGVVTAAENAAASQAMFDRMDANHDGKVTTAEMQAGHAAMGREMEEHEGAGHEMGEHAMPGGDAHDMASMKMGDQAGMGRMGEHLRAMDTNHDGRITAAEHAAAAQAMFTRMDTDHDGYLSKAEVEAGHAMMRKAP